MLKETGTEEKRLFYHIFIIGDISIGGSPGPLHPPPGYAYVSRIENDWVVVQAL